MTEINQTILKAVTVKCMSLPYTVLSLKTFKPIKKVDDRILTPCIYYG